MTPCMGTMRGQVVLAMRTAAASTFAELRSSTRFTVISTAKQSPVCTSGSVGKPCIHGVLRTGYLRVTCGLPSMRVWNTGSGGEGALVVRGPPCGPSMMLCVKRSCEICIFSLHMSCVAI